MSQGSRVATRAIQDAVKGRETAVLDMLGVPWRDGAPHISCPYPDHADANPSWRWDELTAKANCTCAERRQSIFDVVMRLEQVDFEAAKIRVAEILGRGDLIKAQDVERHQPMDAGSLLRPPADLRDDQLVRTYLGARLGLPPDEVPMPVTLAVAWKALPYFDAPASKRAKPKLVGQFPCVIFETRAPDDGRHAHRIYVAAGGTGKADLGVDGRGRKRDPKKSATVRPGTSSSGRVVIWGDVNVAQRIVVTEGIETAAAVAVVYRRDLERGDCAVVAAISAAGIRSFKAWAAARTVTIAADRDESGAAGDAGYRAGEKAARAWALQHHAEYDIRIALPGDAGEDCDWLDLLLRDGPDAARAGIDDAEPFIASAEELEEAQHRAALQAELAEIERQYPLPEMETSRLSYLAARSGRILVHIYAGKDGEGNDSWIPIATPFGVPARLRHADQADAYGLRVTVKGMDGRSRSIEFDRATLPRMGASDIRAQLFAAGLRIEGDGEATVVQALKAADPPNEIIIVSRPGWHWLPELSAPVFVSPTGQIIGACNGCRVELAASACLPASAVAGTFEGWRAAVTAAVTAEGTPHWILAVCAPFAGPIVQLALFESCGINLSGLTSCGKTISQRLAVSAWTSPRLGAGLLQSLRTTENALETLAQGSTGTILALDEMAHVDGQALARMIYSLASGIGKARLTVKLTLLEQSHWSLFGILSGECSLEEKVQGDGGTWLAGMAVRFPDVDVTEVNRAVPQATLDAMAAIAAHHGHAGPLFVQRLIGEGYHRDTERLRCVVLKAATKLAGADADSALKRAAIPFALLLTAGELAKTLGVLPEQTEVAEAVQWGWRRFRASSDAVALDPAGQVIANLRGWIAERWDVTIKPTEPAVSRFGYERENNRESVGWYDDTAVYVPSRRIREAAGSALKEQEIARLLDQRGLLAARERQRLALRYVPKIGHVQNYALRRSEFGRLDRAKEHEFTVRDGGRR
jgi:hypothetical protein